MATKNSTAGLLPLDLRGLDDSDADTTSFYADPTAYIATKIGVEVGKRLGRLEARIDALEKAATDKARKVSE